MDEIVIEELRVLARIGVPDEERKSPQLLKISLTLRPKAGLSGLGDELERTIDYQNVCDRVTELAEGEERKLIESLAEDIAVFVLREHPLKSVVVEVKKFILPETTHVAVRLEREA